MRRRFTDRIDGVVATDAITRDVVVIEVGRYEARGRVAVLAGIATQNMIRILAYRDRVVVTARAGPQYLQMIDASHGREADDAVAVFADNCR